MGLGFIVLYCTGHVPEKSGKATFSSLNVLSSLSDKMHKTAVVLCGGRGTRIEAVSPTLPKCLLPIGGAPFLSLLVRRLSSEGFSPVVLVGGHRIEQLVRFVADNGWTDVQVLSDIEGTAHAVGTAFAHLSEAYAGPVLVMNGDTILDLNYSELLRYHQEKGSDTTIVTSTRLDAQNLGAVKIDGKSKRVLGFGEGEGWSVSEGQSNCGCYLFNLDTCIPWFAKGQWSSLEKEALPALVAVLKVFAYCNGDRFFLDFGTPDRLRIANENAQLIEKLY